MTTPQPLEKAKSELRKLVTGAFNQECYVANAYRICTTAAEQMVADAVAVERRRVAEVLLDARKHCPEFINSLAKRMGIELSDQPRKATP